jgi:hypothetical protein
MSADVADVGGVKVGGGKSAKGGDAAGGVKAGGNKSAKVGGAVGAAVGTAVGAAVGELVGAFVGAAVGAAVGSAAVTQDWLPSSAKNTDVPDMAKLRPHTWTYSGGLSVRMLNEMENSLVLENSTMKQRFA